MSGRSRDVWRSSLSVSHPTGFLRTQNFAFSCRIKVFNDHERAEKFAARQAKSLVVKSAKVEKLT